MLPSMYTVPDRSLASRSIVKDRVFRNEKIRREHMQPSGGNLGVGTLLANVHCRG